MLSLTADTMVLQARLSGRVRKKPPMSVARTVAAGEPLPSALQTSPSLGQSTKANPLGCLDCCCILTCFVLTFPAVLRSHLSPTCRLPFFCSQAAPPSLAGEYIPVTPSGCPRAPTHFTPSPYLLSLPSLPYLPLFKWATPCNLAHLVAAHCPSVRRLCAVDLTHPPTLLLSSRSPAPPSPDNDGFPRPSQYKIRCTMQSSSASSRSCAEYCIPARSSGATPFICTSHPGFTVSPGSLVVWRHSSGL
jgi:hypothetical protein